MARKSVKCITISGLGTAGIYSASVIDGRTTNNGEIAAYGDKLFSTAAQPVLHASDLTVDIVDEGDGYFGLNNIQSLVGKTVTVQITTDYGDGSTTETPVEMFATGEQCVILEATGDSIPVDSDGHSLIHVTLRKQATEGTDVIRSTSTTP